MPMTEVPQNGSDESLFRQIVRNLGCEGHDLSGVDFEDLSESGPFTFRNCTILDVTIRGEALSGSLWEDCTFLRVEFVGVNLRDSTFKRCTFFDKETTSGSKFRFCDMVRARFDDCNLSLSTFLRCNGYEISFCECPMRGVNFDGTTFQHKIGKKFYSKAVFERCQMIDAVMTELDLTSTEFRDCRLVNADFTESRLVNSEMVECDLMSIQIDRADFSGADLRRSDLTGFDLESLRSYASMQISATEQHHLLSSLGIEVSPE